MQAMLTSVQQMHALFPWVRVVKPQVNCADSCLLLLLLPLLLGLQAGNSRSLQRLAKVFLGMTIQQPPQQPTTASIKQCEASGRKMSQQRQKYQVQHAKQRQAVRSSQHDPEEDAAAVMRLYQQVVLPTTYEGQVAAATQQLLLEIQQRQRQQQHDDGDDGDDTGDDNSIMTTAASNSISSTSQPLS
jgi:predicted membrane metal-binding protein